MSGKKPNTPRAMAIQKYFKPIRKDRLPAHLQQVVAACDTTAKEFKGPRCRLVCYKVVKEFSVKEFFFDARDFGAGIFLEKCSFPDTPIPRGALVLAIPYFLWDNNKDDDDSEWREKEKRWNEKTSQLLAAPRLLNNVTEIVGFLLAYYSATGKVLSDCWVKSSDRTSYNKDPLYVRWWVQSWKTSIQISSCNWDDDGGDPIVGALMIRVIPPG